MTSSLHNTKMTISLKQKKIFRKEKCHSSVFQKAFQISRKYFSCHIHFKDIFDDVPICNECNSNERRIVSDFLDNLIYLFINLNKPHG